MAEMLRFGFWVICLRLKEDRPREGFVHWCVWGGILSLTRGLLSTLGQMTLNEEWAELQSE